MRTRNYYFHTEKKAKRNDAEAETPILWPLDVKN